MPDGFQLIINPDEEDATSGAGGRDGGGAAAWAVARPSASGDGSPLLLLLPPLSDLLSDAAPDFRDRDQDGDDEALYPLHYPPALQQLSPQLQYLPLLTATSAPAALLPPAAPFAAPAPAPPPPPPPPPPLAPAISAPPPPHLQLPLLAPSAARASPPASSRQTSPRPPRSSPGPASAGGSTASAYTGATRHRRSQRWEAHIWVRGAGGAGGKQVYLGGHSDEASAAAAYDVVHLSETRISGKPLALNFPLERYAELLPLLPAVGSLELVAAVRQAAGAHGSGDPVAAAVAAARVAAAERVT
jgi:hypothetical protein